MMDVPPARHDDYGFSLLETVFALSLLMVVALGLLPLGALSIATTENQGHLMARATEYAQDKLEQLLTLAYCDQTSDTRVFPATGAGGSGLKVGGSSNPSTPVALYVDYLNADGTLMASAGTTAPAGWYYKRVWQITQSQVSATTTCGAVPDYSLKQVTVTATVKSAVARSGRVPEATVTALKTFPF
jgi:type II secretory pathway pseudopilin PulG